MIDIGLFNNEYIGTPLLKPYLRYKNIKSALTIQGNDLKF